MTAIRGVFFDLYGTLLCYGDIEAAGESWFRAIRRELQGRYKLALISNFDHPPHIHQLLGELALRPFFDAVVVSGDVGVKKPDPAIFTPALEQTGLVADEALFVGDSPEDDVAGARAAGLRPVLIRRSLGADGSPAKPEWTEDGVRVVAGLREVIGLIG